MGVAGSEVEENFIGYYQVKSQRNPPNSELNIYCLPTSSKQFSVRCTAEHDQRHKYKDVAHTRSVEFAAAYYNYINILCTILQGKTTSEAGAGGQKTMGSRALRNHLTRVDFRVSIVLKSHTGVGS